MANEQTDVKQKPLAKNKIFDWILRFFKGAVIGMDFVLPGISGAALAVVFGLYERIVSFIANITKDFLKNILFFLPVGIGLLLGIYLVSHPISFLLENPFTLTPFLWFFIGAILGTTPELWKKSGEKGRKPFHLILLVSVFIIGTLFFLFSLETPLDLQSAHASLDAHAASAAQALSADKPHGIIAFLVGAAVALIMFVPGFSSSTFLLLIGLYKPVIDSYKNFGDNLSFLIPFVLGILIFIFPFSKGINFLIKKNTSIFYHVITGFVLASAVLVGAIASGWRQGWQQDLNTASFITESGYYNYLQFGSIVCLIALIAGAVLSFWMCRLSNKYEQ